MKNKKCFNCTQVLDFAALPAAANGSVTCPACGESNTPDMEASALACRALAALPELNADGSLPADIQLFPPGKDVPFTLQDYPDQEFRADVDAATALRLDAQLQTMIARAGAGQGARPFGDKNHEDAEATFHPTKIFWAGEDPKTGGVRMVTNWTPFGAGLVKARAFGYASGNFRFAPALKKITGLLGENNSKLKGGYACESLFHKIES